MNKITTYRFGRFCTPTLVDTSRGPVYCDEGPITEEMMKDLSKTITTCLNFKDKLSNCPSCFTLPNKKPIEEYLDNDDYEWSTLIETMETLEMGFLKFIELREQNINREIQKLTAPDKYLTPEETCALLMLKGRQRELNSILGKLKNSNLLQMVLNEETKNESVKVPCPTYY